MLFASVLLLVTCTTAFANIISTHNVQAKDLDMDAKELWTIDNLARTPTRKNRVCKWHMTIDRSYADESPGLRYGGGIKPPNIMTCEFEIKGRKGSDCRDIPFNRRQCDHYKFPYYISGASIDRHNYLLTVDSVIEDKQAIFTYPNAMLDSGEDIPYQTSPVVEPDGDDGDDGPAVPPKQNYRDNYDPVPGKEWTIANMKRHINTNSSTMDMSFELHTNDNQEPSVCSLHLKAPAGTDMASWTWYEKRMDDCGFFASWGYMPENDGGVMTLVSPSRMAMAWFGFNGINAAESLGQSGPNPIYPCNCGGSNA